MEKYCVYCRKHTNFTEVYRTKKEITYKCDTCGYILVVRLWK